MSVIMWAVWALVLILQNFAFTFVSRARNSGSLRRHMVASVFSNGVWFISQVLIFSTMFKMMTGQFGIKAAIFTGAYYTAFTMAGSLLAHYTSLKTEKGKGAVGASAKYAQFTAEEGEIIRQAVIHNNSLQWRVLTLDVGKGGTFTTDELRSLSKLAALPADDIKQLLGTFFQVVKADPGYVPMPQAPKASQGEGGRVIKSGVCVA